MPNKPDHDNKEKLATLRALKNISIDLEKLVGKLSNTDALNEASYLRKAITEIKKAMRTL